MGRVNIFKKLKCKTNIDNFLIKAIFFNILFIIITNKPNSSYLLGIANRDNLLKIMPKFA
jgi:hypothetical protein